MFREPAPQPTVTAGQMRAARAYLGWSLAEAAAESGRSVLSVKMAEDPTQLPRVQAAAAAIRNTYEAFGISFLPMTVDGTGVRMRGEGG